MNPINHVAIIMDGNGRWGIKHKGSRNLGHKHGLNVVEAVIEQCVDEDIKYLTLYTFSTENWKRPKNEVDFLFDLLENFLIKKIKNLINKNIKLNFIGELDMLPKKLKYLIKSSEKKTSHNFGIQVNVALNYGSKSELIKKKLRLMKKILIKIYLQVKFLIQIY